MAGAIVQYESGNTSFIDAEAQWVSSEISGAREDKQDFVLFIARGKQVWVDPNKVEAVFSTEE